MIDVSGTYEIAEEWINSLEASSNLESEAEHPVSIGRQIPDPPQIPFALGRNPEDSLESSSDDDQATTSITVPVAPSKGLFSFGE